jgi:deoxyadenosine/deoxycytidine kinase
MTSARKPLFVSIDGIIAAGKTYGIMNCLIPLLTKKGWRIQILKEPIDSWLASGIFQRFTADKSRWAYTFQHRVVFDRTKAIKDAYELNKDSIDIFITERCIFSDRYTFAEMLHDSGYIDDVEWKLYLDWFDWYIAQNPSVFPDLIVYFQAPVMKCMERIKTRNRDGEIYYTPEYLGNLLAKHEKFLGGEYISLSSGQEIPIFKISTENDLISEPMRQGFAETLEIQFKKIIDAH